MLKILVVEDHALVCEGLVHLVAQVEQEVTVLSRPDFESALILLETESDFDLIMLDLALPGIDGFSGLDILRRRYPAIPVVVVSAFDDQPTVTRVMNLGASGFIPKAFSGEALLAAIREVLAGNLFRPQGAYSGARFDAAAPRPTAVNARVSPAEVGLTDRQGQVLALMVQGMSNRDIAEHLGLTEGTVKIHVTAVFKALGVSSRTQALVAVARHGIDLSSVF